MTRVLALLAAVAALVACARPSPLASGSPVSFTDEGATAQSGYDDPAPKVELGRSGDRWLVTVYQGRQNTGGYAVRVEKMNASGTLLRIGARFTRPAPDAMVTQALTSPAHTVGIPFGPDGIVLYDQDEREVARWTAR